MSLSSSLYASISGLNTMGSAMSILGDNVSNVNTVSYKASRASFQDALSQSIATSTGVDQVGRGVNLGAVNGLFAQGSFESTTSPTDLAIGGQGFFMLREAEASEAQFYTRAGEFRFDQDGNLVSPNGYFVQGWDVDSKTAERTGTIKDIIIEKNTAPVATSAIDVVVNLDSREQNESTENRLFEAWDGSNAAALVSTPSIASSDYEYTTSIKVYDTQGASHDITVYFDRTTEDNKWEFLITCDPTEDMRYLPDGVDESGQADGSPNWQTAYAPNERYNYEDHKGAGALLYGVIQFNTAGDVTDIAAYNIPPDGKVDPAVGDNRIALTQFDDYYNFEYNFTGDTVNQAVTINFGAKYTGNTTNQTQIIVSDSGAFANSTGNATIFADTLWGSVYDAAGKQVSDGDTFVVEGFKHTGQATDTLVYTVDSTEKVQDFLDALETTFACSVAIDENGKLKFTSNQGGESGLAVTSFKTFSANSVVPFGGSTIIRKNWAEADTAFMSGSSSTAVPITDTSTALTSCTFSNGAKISPGYKLRFGGFSVGELDNLENTDSKKTMGQYIDPKPINATFTVGQDGTTIQDLLEWLETLYGSETEENTVSSALGKDGKIKLIDNTVTADQTDGGNLEFKIDWIGDLHMALGDVSGGIKTIVSQGAKTGVTDVLYQANGAPATTESTQLTDLFSADGTRQVMKGDSYSFGGVNTNGTNVIEDTFVVGTDGDTIQDLLDWLPSLYEVVSGEVTATLNAAGRIEISDTSGGNQMEVTLSRISAGLAKPLGDDGINLLAPARPIGEDTHTIVTAGSATGSGPVLYGGANQESFATSSATLITDLYDQNGYRLKQNDTLVYSGVAVDGTVIPATSYTIGATDTIQDLMDDLSDLFADGTLDGTGADADLTVTLNAITGRMNFTDTTAGGNLAMNQLTLLATGGSGATRTMYADNSINAEVVKNANQSLMNVFDASGYRLQAGDIMAFSGTAVGRVVASGNATGSSPVLWGDNAKSSFATVNTELLTDLFDNNGTQYQIGDTLTYSGTAVDGTPIASAVFTLTGAEDVGDLETWLSDMFADGALGGPFPGVASANLTVALNPATGELDFTDTTAGGNLAIFQSITIQKTQFSEFEVGTDGGTVNDLMAWISDVFADGNVGANPTADTDVSVTLNASGQISFTDNGAGRLNMLLEDTTKAPTKFFYNTGGAYTPNNEITDGNTALVNTYDQFGSAVKAGDTLTFTGTAINGEAVDGSFTVGEDGSSIQDFLDWLADLYDDGDVLGNLTTAIPLGADSSTFLDVGDSSGQSGILYTDAKQTNVVAVGAEATTNLVDIYDSAGHQIRKGDVMKFSGNAADGSGAMSGSFTIGQDGSTLQDLMDWVSDLFADGTVDGTGADPDVDVTLNADGKLVFTDGNGGGNLSITLDSSSPTNLVVSLNAISGEIQFTNNDDPGVNPVVILDWTGSGMTTSDSYEGQINITTSKRQILTTGRGLSTNSQGPPYISSSTFWRSVYNDNGVSVTNGDKMTFTGTKSDGSAATMTYTVDTTAPNNVKIQDLLSDLEEAFDCQAQIDNSGRIVLSDRIADSSSYSSQLDLTTITYDYATTVPINTNFHAVFGFGSTAITGDLTSEDGSRSGGVVSSSFESEALSSTQYANSSTTILKDQDGYGSGFLQSISVDTDGIITGHFSNGQVIKKAQVALANFNNLEGLKKEGGNIFTQTTDSGAAITGAAGTNGLGSIASNALEQSNVDLGSEFVKLITTQRGFQANSKIITTVDQMLDTLINIKR